MFFVTQDGGLTAAGYTLVAVAVFLLLIVISVFAGGRKKIGAKQLAYCSMALALAVVCSQIKLFRLPTGGSITLFSMLFVVLIGYWYGPVVGLLAGVTYGLLRLVLGPYIVSLPQMLVDYPIAFGALGISGFFCNRKNGLVIGYIAAVLGRFFFAVLSGVIFFGMYAPEGMNPILYSISYNGFYLFAEGLLTVILLAVPAVRKALMTVKMQAKA
jgi:thiamine transporter